jgi:hypothetical protein
MEILEGDFESEKDAWRAATNADHGPKRGRSS